MQSCYDPDVSTEIFTRRVVKNFGMVVIFWLFGFFYPIVFPPESYHRMLKLESKRFPNSSKFVFDRHLRSEEIHDYFQRFAKFYDHKAEFFDLKPLTFEGRPIGVFRVSLPTKDYFKNPPKKKSTIVVVAAMYASIWDSTSAAIDLAHKLCEECLFKVLFTMQYDWYIVPLANPDGYNFSLRMRDVNLHLSSSPKNRVLYNNPDNPRGCRGVYIDRNFGFHWGESKEVDYNNYCWMGFAGPHPFSENETQALVKFSKTLVARNETVSMYIQLHGSTTHDALTYPWRFTSQHSDNHQVMHDMADVATDKARVKTGFQFFPEQSGGSDLGSGLFSDYLMGLERTLYAFSIEPTFSIRNSTEVSHQEIYVEKANTIVWSLAFELHKMDNKI